MCPICSRLTATLSNRRVRAPGTVRPGSDAHSEGVALAMPSPESTLDGPPVGLVFDDRFLQHNPGLETIWPSDGPFPFVDPILHMSNHRLVMRTKHLIDLTGLGKKLVRIDASPATVDDLAMYHTRDYIARVEALCAAGGGESGQGAPVAPDSYEIALLAAGAGMAAVDAAVLRSCSQSLRQCPPTRSSCHCRLRHGLLRLQQRRHRRPPRPAIPRHQARPDRRLGRPSRQRHPGRLLRRPRRPLLLPPPG